MALSRRSNWSCKCVAVVVANVILYPMLIFLSFEGIPDATERAEKGTEIITQRAAARVGRNDEKE